MIILDYILIPKFDEETVFNKICDNYNKRLSLEEARSRVGLYPDQYCKEGYWIGLDDFIE